MRRAPTGDSLSPEDHALTRPDRQRAQTTAGRVSASNQGRGQLRFAQSPIDATPPQVTASWPFKQHPALWPKPSIAGDATGPPTGGPHLSLTKEMLRALHARHPSSNRRLIACRLPTFNDIDRPLQLERRRRRRRRCPEINGMPTKFEFMVRADRHIPLGRLPGAAHRERGIGASAKPAGPYKPHAAGGGGGDDAKALVDCSA